MRPQEFGSAGDEFHELYAGTGRVNAVREGEPVAPYEMLCGLLVPLYAARAAEEAFYGRRAVTLSTAKEVRALWGIWLEGFGYRAEGPPNLRRRMTTGAPSCSALPRRCGRCGFRVSDPTHRVYRPLIRGGVLWPARHHAQPRQGGMRMRADLNARLCTMRCIFSVAQDAGMRACTGRYL